MRQKHFHQYQKFIWPKGGIYYKCMIPGCPHFLPIAEQAIGRESLCWGPACNNLVVITQEDVQKEIKKPLCDKCRAERAQRREEMKEIV